MENQALEAEVEAEIQSQHLNDSRNSNDSKGASGNGDNKSVKSLKLDNIDTDAKSEETEMTGKEIVVDILNNIIENAIATVTENSPIEIVNLNHMENETQSVTSSLTR